MKTLFSVCTTTPDQPLFNEIVRFADEVCFDRVDMHIRRRADLFIYAHVNDLVIGSLGLHRGDTNPELIFEMCDPPNAFERLTNEPRPDRSLLAEVGSRAVRIPNGLQIKSREVSVAMTAMHVLISYAQGIRYLGFVSNPLAPAIAAAVGIPLVVLGKPDYSRQNAVFLKNVERIARTRQVCYGCEIISTNGCYAALTALEEAGSLVKGNADFLFQN